MRPQLGAIFLVWSIFVSLPALSAAGNDPEALNLELHIEDDTILSCGVLVGTLAFRNDGDSNYNIGGVLSIDSIDFKYQLEKPNGKVVTLSGRVSRDVTTVQWARLGPNEAFFHPICLLKIGDRYLFRQPGQYRIRAIYLVKAGVEFTEGLQVPTVENPNPPKPQRQIVSPHITAKSNWSSFEVIAGYDRDSLYTESHPWRDMYRAFMHSRPRGIDGIKQQIGLYGDYDEEQKKIVIYQSIGGRLFKELLINQTKSPSLIREAEDILSFARESNIGVEMWEWIVSRLKSFPLEDTSRERWNARCGYYF